MSENNELQTFIIAVAKIFRNNKEFFQYYKMIHQAFTPILSFNNEFIQIMIFGFFKYSVTQRQVVYFIINGKRILLLNYYYYYLCVVKI